MVHPENIASLHQWAGLAQEKDIQPRLTWIYSLQEQLRKSLHAKINRSVRKCKLRPCQTDLRRVVLGKSKKSPKSHPLHLQRQQKLHNNGRLWQLRIWINDWGRVPIRTHAKEHLPAEISGHNPDKEQLENEKRP